MAVPIHPTLAEAIAAHPARHAVYLVTGDGRPFTVAGLGNWLREARKKAAMPAGMSPHGLRKAAARRLAEAGCSALQIQAVTGHRSLRELEVYVRQTDRVTLADAAFATLRKSER